MSKILTDREIDDAADRLAAFRARNAEEDFLQRYADLLTSYKQLKSDYEEERVGRERYKQLARNQERNPFVLVIVDGDGYIFKDDFLQQGAEGGSRAAQSLNDVIKKSLHGKGLEHCDVMIRIYANLANLSRTLSKYGLATPDKRSLSPFVANFNRSYGLMDFIDAGELKENADFKIRALLNLYADNVQCKHIYFAACHDVGYLSDLTRFRGDRNRVTLIRSSGLLFHDQFQRLDLGIEEFFGVFRTIPLDSTVLHTKTNLSADLIKTTPPTGPSATASTSYQATSSWESPKICQFYQSGKCRFGGDCKNAHIDPRIPTPANSTKTLYPSQAGHRSNTDADITGSSGRVRSSVTTSLSEFDSVASSPISYRSEPIYHLPKKSEIPDGCVAVNKHLQRLDPYMPPPSPVASNTLRELSNKRKFCNNKQLTNFCPNENCDYEHEPIPKELLPALEWLSRSLPCTKRGSCRAYSCVLGHICQNTECQHRGGKIKCKLPGYAHSVDLAVDQYLPDPGYASPVNPSPRASSPSTLTPSRLSGHVNQVPGIDPWDLS